MRTKYDRVLLKLSGESLMGEQGHGLTLMLRRLRKFHTLNGIGLLGILFLV